MWYIDALFAMHPNMRGHTGGPDDGFCRTTQLDTGNGELQAQ
jgi:hypothetical protein